ncbi:helix-turn-helix domain-containing protein [Croceitalea rosinachiae]|uniref:Helix-turn-helix domain-containing protein n=1 Tax=Croceitalea rosinachiae TaxID=3075596 RepID=A0ABU3AA59_9FLAO|nr:helix-turn-helix domain-containing protein [Croceitalea sp. F388]MDT0607071.1 helix-turn-helix domain-containing protein [Croceitalea sp. F388]
MSNQAALVTEKSLVVLPFKNLSGDHNNDYFSDGITVEIINALTKIDGLKVTARTSSFAFKNKPTDIRIIGNELGVTNAVEGSIRIVKERIRISAQLTRTDTGFLLWSEKFDRKLDDVFALQDEISLLIADKIRENFGHIEIDDSLAEVQTENLTSYQWYLRGRYYQLTWNLDNMERAIVFFEKATDFDSSYADPVVSIGWCYAIIASWGHIDRKEGLEKANLYLDKGLKMNPNSYTGYFGKATISFWGNWQFEKGFQELQLCLNENPHFSEGREGLAELLTATGFFEKAAEETEQILKINPLSPNHYYTKGNLHYLQGDYQTALSCFKSSLKLDNSFDLSRHLRVACLLFLGDKQETLSYAKSFLDDKLVTIIEAIFNSVNKNQVPEYDKSLLSENLNLMVYWDFYYLVHCQKTEIALERLKEMVEQRIGQIINFQFDPFLEPLRNTKVFKELQNAVFGSIQPSTFDIEANKTIELPTFTQKESDELISALDQVLSREEAFLRADLSLRSLAEELVIHPNRLSKFINDYLQTNFTEMVNGKRLEHFQKIAVSPKNNHLTLLGLAYESGFNSKTVFNTYFKKMTGMTPKQWIKANQ